MPKINVSLSIGYPSATKKDTLEVDETEWEECTTEEERESLLQEYWQDWANNHIEGNFHLID